MMIRMMRIMILIFLLFFLTSLPVTADRGGKVLVYYFQNLTGESEYNDLIYRIPLCLMGKLNENFHDGNFIIIDQAYLSESTAQQPVNLWDRECLQRSASSRKIERVLYGLFYIEGDRIIIRGKTYYTDRGIIVDVNENTSEFYPVFREIEKLSVADIRGCYLGEEFRTYKPPAKSLPGGFQIRTERAFSFLIGPFFPVSEWGELYRYGAYGELSYSLFPRRGLSPVGLSVETCFLTVRREEDPYYVSSSAMIVPLGISLNYALIGKQNDWVIIGVSAGLSLSKLTVSSNVSLSIDPYTKGSLNILFPVGKNSQIVLSSGLITVSYRVSPLNAWYCDIGLRSYKF